MMTDEALPEPVLEQAVRLTRAARAAPDPERTRRLHRERDDLLEAHGFVARVRDGERTGESAPVLVCYPDAWRDGKTVAIDRIEDLDRAIERPLDGRYRDEDWEAVEEKNRKIAASIREEYGPVHGANADAFADFMGNHRNKRIEDARPEDLETFRSDYYVRNVWPSEEERAAIDDTLEIIERVVDGEEL